MCVGFICTSSVLAIGRPVLDRSLARSTSRSLTELRRRLAFVVRFKAYSVYGGHRRSLTYSTTS